MTRIAFQGEPGAYSHEACRTARPGSTAVPCPTFEETIEAVREGRVRPGARVMLVGFGVGFSWGATILTWN